MHLTVVVINASFIKNFTQISMKYDSRKTLIDINILSIMSTAKSDGLTVLSKTCGWISFMVFKFLK